MELLTISMLPLLESCLELSTISGFTYAVVMLGTLFNHQWVYLCWSLLGTLNHQYVYLCWSHAWNSQPSVGLPLLLSCLELYLTISGLPLLESCLELYLTISGFTFAGVMVKSSKQDSSKGKPTDG